MTKQHKFAQPRRALSLRRRLTIIVLLLFIVALLLLVSTNQVLQRRALENSAATELSQMLSRTRTEVESTLASLRNLFNQGAVVMTIGYDPDGQLASLRYLQEKILNFALYDSDGTLVYSLEKITRESQHSIANAPWFAEATIANRIFPIAKPPLNEEALDSCYTLSRRIYYAQSGAMHSGVFLMEVDPTAFEQTGSAQRLGQFSTTYLTDENGSWIAPIAASSAQRQLPALPADQKPAIEKDSPDGRERFRASTTIGYYNWRVYALVYGDEINQPLQTYAVSIITSAFIVLGLLILAVVFAASRITRPLRDISGALTAIDSDNFSRQMPVQGRTEEIDNVARAINRLLQHIERLLADTREKQDRIRRAELVALNQQITPHFLGNALDSIIWTLQNGQTEKGIAMIEVLGRLLRSAAALMLDLTLPLGRELEYIRRYMEFQQMRRGGRITLSVDCPDDIARLHCPHMLLQPLIENALQHGLALIQEGRIEITARLSETGQNLLIAVRDNGEGMSADRLREIQSQLDESEPGAAGTERGIGLTNIHQRIRLLYGAPYGLTVESVEEEYTCVTIRLPRVEGDSA